MKITRSMIIALLLPTTLFCAQEQKDAWSKFFAGVADRVYCEAECSGSSEKIQHILAEANNKFDEMLKANKPLAEEKAGDILQQIAYNGTAEMLEALLQNTDFNGFDDIHPVTKRTPLMTSAMFGNVDLVRELIKRGADITKTTTIKIAGEEHPNLSALELSRFVPLTYIRGGFAVLEILPTIISRSARYSEYDKSTFGPFAECERLIKNALNCANKAKVNDVEKTIKGREIE